MTDEEALLIAQKLDALYAAAAEHDEKTFREWLANNPDAEPEEDEMAILRKAALSNGQP